MLWIEKFLVTIGICSTVLLPMRAYAETEKVPAIGIIGDSYSDEYIFYKPDRSHARNWGELLAGLQRANFGHFSGMRRSAPQSRGFLFNLALDGLTSAAAVNGGYDAALAQLISAGKIQYAVIFIGGNDFLDELLLGNSADEASVALTVKQNIAAMVQTLEQAGDARIVVATLPDISLLPAVQDARSAGIISRRTVHALQDAVLSLNEDLKNTFQADAHVRIADLAAATKAALSSGTLKVGGYTISSRTTGDSFVHLFLDDGIHIGTAAQGLLANQFARTINAFGVTHVKKLAGREIVQAAQNVADLK